jgi:hypothetical protein
MTYYFTVIVNANVNKCNIFGFGFIFLIACLRVTSESTKQLKSTVGQIIQDLQQVSESWWI